MNAPKPHFFSIPFSKYEGKVPSIITDILRQLKLKNAKENEGVFRFPAQRKDISNLCEELDNGHVQNWDQYDSPAIEGAFKKYLENLSVIDPLIPDDIKKEFEDVPSEISDDQIGRYYHDIFANKYSNLLTHRSTLAFIFNFLNKEIIPNEEKNLMNARNLSICLFMLFFKQQN